jgi:hypothetical protein
LTDEQKTKAGIMIIDEFEFWQNYTEFSDPWYKKLCYDVSIPNS